MPRAEAKRPLKENNKAPSPVWTVRTLPRPITRDPGLMAAQTPPPTETEARPDDADTMPMAAPLPTPKRISPTGPISSPDAEGGVLSRRILYYGTDRDVLSASDREVALAHAQFLSRHPDVSVRLAGYCDERGSREYNLALGLRRSLGIKQLFMLSGVNPERIFAGSYGKERPRALGHDERAWARNRRVEILYGDEP